MSNDQQFYETLANRFCAWLEGVCWHTGDYHKGLFIPHKICQRCLEDAEYRYPNRDYIHDANAMLDRVLPAIETRQGNLLCLSINWIETLACGSDTFCKSIIQALLQTPLWDEFVETLEVK